MEAEVVVVEAEVVIVEVVVVEAVAVVPVGTVSAQLTLPVSHAMQEGSERDQEPRQAER